MDATQTLIREAIQRKCNLVIVHHPLLFRPLKNITGKNDIQNTVIEAIKNDIAIYSIHTNLDNVLEGVSGKMAEKLGLTDVEVLETKRHRLQKLSVYIPESHYDEVISALFEAGAGSIGNYTECSFNTTGTGTFKPGAEANPYTGEVGKRQYEQEIKTEVIFEDWKSAAVLRAMKEAHPYEEVAYYIQSTENEYKKIGSGAIGHLQKSLTCLLYTSPSPRD